MLFSKPYLLIYTLLLLHPHLVRAAIRFESLLIHPGNHVPVDLIETSSRDFVIVGYSYSGSNYDAFISKLDSRGRLLWAKETESSYLGTFEGVLETLDGGFIVTGDLKHSFAQRSAVILKFDANGNLQWGREIRGYKINEGRKVIQTSDGSYVVAGRIRAEGQGGEDAFILKVDGNGNKQWLRIYGFSSDDKGI